MPSHFAQLPRDFTWNVFFSGSIAVGCMIGFTVARIAHIESIGVVTFLGVVASGAHLIHQLGRVKA